MASHVVMLPPAGGPQSRAEQAVLVRDGFSWLAFLVSPLWLLWHWLWLEAIIVVAVMAALGAFGEAAGPGMAGSLLGLLVPIYVGLEGQAMRIAALGRRGYRQWGVVEAANAEEAYMRYVHEEVDRLDEPEPAVAIVAAEGGGKRPARTVPSLGLIPYGRH